MEKEEFNQFTDVISTDGQPCLLSHTKRRAQFLQDLAEESSVKQLLFDLNIKLRVICVTTTDDN